jgi:TusA-related sulfurtransferase
VSETVPPETDPTEAPAQPATDDRGRIIVDALGLPCPQPVIMLATATRTAAVGDELRLLADDQAADVDVPVWCRMQRQLLVSQTADGATLTFIVRKLREI